MQQDFFWVLGCYRFVKEPKKQRSSLLAVSSGHAHMRIYIYIYMYVCIYIYTRTHTFYMSSKQREKLQQ